MFKLLKHNKRIRSVVIVLLDKLMANQLVKRIFILYEERKIIEPFARACYCADPGRTSIQSANSCVFLTINVNIFLLHT
jgi:hypothetical protein